MRFPHLVGRVGTMVGGAFLILHGVAHGPGVLGSWKLATFADISRRPNALWRDAPEWAVVLLGGVWLLAGAAFVVAGIETLRRSPRWRTMVLIAALLSLVPCLLWREDAIVGLVIDLVVLAVLAASEGWAQWRARRAPARRPRGAVSA